MKYKINGSECFKCHFLLILMSQCYKTSYDCDLQPIMLLCYKHANYCNNKKHIGMSQLNKKWCNDNKDSADILGYENSQICQRLYIT